MSDQGKLHFVLFITYRVVYLGFLLDSKLNVEVLVSEILRKINAELKFLWGGLIQLQRESPCAPFQNRNK